MNLLKKEKKRRKKKAMQRRQLLQFCTRGIIKEPNETLDLHKTPEQSILKFTGKHRTSESRSWRPSDVNDAIVVIIL